MHAVAGKLVMGGDVLREFKNYLCSFIVCSLGPDAETVLFCSEVDDNATDFISLVKLLSYACQQLHQTGLSIHHWSLDALTSPCQASNFHLSRR